ncbi:NUDIX domain-containing protein [Candidatus Saccharibacteria bacterium]|nr:NUDIX domain-containing protein [Candidatus Saccharibacteria bacterium]
MPKPKLPNFGKIKPHFKRKPQINEIGREPTAGGVIFRHDNKGEVEILLIQDAKDRWTIPKGHVEPGETAMQTAIREIGEEVGLKNIKVLGWLGKVNFKYRRLHKLVLMGMQVYLVKSTDQDEDVVKEEWMKDAKWFKFNDAIAAVEYEDISKLMLLAKRRIREGNL